MLARLGTMFAELASLLSCLLNVLAGGQREITFSAASWEMAMYAPSERQRARGRRRVRFVNALNRMVTGETDHCRKAWNKHLDFWRVRMNRAAYPSPPM